MNWSEKLPDGCPPEDAITPPSDVIFYRVVWTVPPTEKDFASMVSENPKRAKTLIGSDKELNTYGVSLFDNIDGAKRVKRQRKMPYIVEVRLTKEDGVVVNTGKGHWTWWKTDSFSIEACKKVEL